VMLARLLLEIANARAPKDDQADYGARDNRQATGGE